MRLELPWGIHSARWLLRVGVRKPRETIPDKAVATGQKAPPDSDPDSKNFAEAFRGPGAMKWVSSANEEMDGLTEIGVLGHDYTYQMLLAIDAGVVIMIEEATRYIMITCTVHVSNLYH